MISLTKILVPIDFSEHSQKAVLYGAELASKFGAEVQLLHAVEPQPIIYAEGGAFPMDGNQELVQHAIKQLDLVKVHCEDQLKVTRDVCEGTAFVEIVQFAKNNETDLIVMGTHGRGAIAHMLLGSVAERVIRKAPCPVLVVRDEEHDFVMP